MDTKAGAHSHPYLPTPEDFRSWLEARLATGEARAAVGRSLGVSHEAVRVWLTGGRVSVPVLLLAGHLMSEPRELAAGLPERG